MAKTKQPWEMSATEDLIDKTRDLGSLFKKFGDEIIAHADRLERHLKKDDDRKDATIEEMTDIVSETMLSYTNMGMNLNLHKLLRAISRREMEQVREAQREAARGNG